MLQAMMLAHVYGLFAGLWDFKQLPVIKSGRNWQKTGLPDIVWANSVLQSFLLANPQLG